MPSNEPPRPDRSISASHPSRAVRGTARLDRETAVTVALGIADRDGLGALTVRQLASELSVSPMALYRYFEDKQELLQAIGTRVGEQMRAAMVAAAPAEGATAWDRLRAMMRVPAEVLARHHRDVMNLIVSEFSRQGEMTVHDVALIGFEQLLGVLAELGVTGLEALQWSSLLVHGSFMLADVTRRPPSDPDADVDRQLHAHWAGLAHVPEDRYPSVVAAARLVPGQAGDAASLMDRGVEMFVSALAHRSEPVD